MRTRASFVLISCLSWFALSACSGGSSDGKISQPSCQGSTAPGAPQVLCLTSCNLGCTAAGCSLNQIAQNQPIFLVFNQDIDPSSVSSSSISLRTASGEQPVGRYLVNGATVTFTPEVRVVGATSFFGFRAGETYFLTLPGGTSGNALRSTAGDEFQTEYVCSLEVSLGVLDFNGAPPTATMISPSATVNVDPQTPIVLEFDELLDVTSFIGATPTTQPILVSARQCGSTLPVSIAGKWQVTNDSIRQVSTASFTSGQAVPSNFCVEVRVTNLVRDLSGKSSLGQVFQYMTRNKVLPPISFVEEFDNDLNLDLDYSAGTWTGGSARAGQLGWDGLHGDFDATIGNDLGNSLYEWSTDNQLIPKTVTLSGVDEVVTDGVFRFSRFILSRGQTVRFVGSNPARIYVRGNMVLDGTIELNGGSLSAHDGNNAVGQAGGIAGAGGAPGGSGANKGSGSGHTPAFDGNDGSDVQLPAGHAYAAQAPGTGGNGSVQFPTDGLTGSIILSWNGFFSAQIAAGGGGGGFSFAGQDGAVIMSNSVPDEGPPGVGGKQLQLFPAGGFPAGASIQDHFGVGGSGGGGSGSHPFLSQGATPFWRCGGGGAGGGGVVGVRVGRGLSLSSSGRILAIGGSTANASTMLNYAVPGGGGAGGSIVLQAADSVSMGGLLDVSGGTGGQVVSSASLMTTSKGGDGSPGSIRLDVPVPNPTISLVGLTNPVPTPGDNSISVGTLTESDATTGSMSIFQNTAQLFPPMFLYYELEATVNGMKTTYSDDPSRGSLAGPSSAIEFLVQGARLDALGQVDPDTVRGWRRYVGDFAPSGQVSLTEDGATVYRFLLLFHDADATVDKVSVVFQPF